MKKLFAIATLIAGSLVMVSCGDDDETTTPIAPVVVGPTSAVSATTGAEATASFTVATAGGYASASVSGGATITAQPDAGALDGTVTVAFTGSAEGATVVTLTVTDNGSQTGTGTATFDVSNPAGPTVSTAAGINSVQVGTQSTVTFSVTGTPTELDAQFTDGLTLTADDISDLVDGVVTVTFTAGSVAGAETITLTATDAFNQSGSATAAIEITESPVPTIAGIPATATLTEGETLMVNGVSLAAEDGLATFTASVNGGAAIDLAGLDGFTVGATSATVNIAFTTEELGAVLGNNTIIFTVTDADGDAATATHILTVEDDFKGTITVTENISANTTWTNDFIYILSTRVTVLSGVTLTIEAGTIVKGGTGVGTSSKALLVARGATLIADGTASQPIIFTSINDEIVPGQIVSPNLTVSDRGLWGGVILLGDAPISVGSGNEAQVEGIPSTDTNGLYGGNNSSHNGGILNYVSIRHAGTDIGDGDEIQGLTVAGVGSETDLNWIEIVASDDDGIEFFGGTVDASNVLIWSSTDDALDTDMDYQGTVSNFIIVAPAGGSAFELDGPEGSAKVNGATGFHTFNNGIVYAGGNVDHLVDWDPSEADDPSTPDEDETAIGTNAALTNIYFYGLATDYPADGFNAIESFQGDGSGTSSNWEVTLNNRTKAQIMGGADGITTSVAANANTVGPTNDDGFEWTFASASGSLAGIGL